MYLSLCTKFLYSEYKKCPQTFPRSLFTLTLHTVLPSLGIWFSSFTCLIIHWTLAPDQALFLEIAGLKTNKAQPWSLHSGIVNLKFQGNMLVWGSVQVLWGHAVQPGRVRGTGQSMTGMCTWNCTSYWDLNLAKTQIETRIQSVRSQTQLKHWLGLELMWPGLKPNKSWLGLEHTVF